MASLIEVLTGEYMPRAEALGQRAAGLLGVDPVVDYGATQGEYQGRANAAQGARSSGALGADPVATQQQSGYRTPRNGRTFYVNSAGQTGTSIPKGSGTAGVYAAAAEDAGAAATKAGIARGILGTLGRTALGGNPVGAGIYAMAPNSVQDQRGEDAELAKNRVSQMDPADVQSANDWAQGVSQRAVQAGMQAASQYTNGTPPVAEANPQTPGDAAQKAVVDQESHRQVLQQGTAQGLQTGAVSRPELAKAVVDADAQRAGKELTPDEHKAAVVEETAAMKTMDDNQLSKYVSYALIGGGLLAAAFDKSGRAGDAFAESYNRSLDRQANAKIQGAKLAQDQLKAILDYKIADRNATTGEKKAETDATYKGVLADQGERKLDQGDTRLANDLALGNARVGASYAGIASREGIAAADRQAREDLGKLNAAVRLKSAKISADAKSGPSGVPPETKDAESLVKSIDGSEAVGKQTATKAAQKVIAQELRNQIKQNPNIDPAAFVSDRYKKLRSTGNKFFGADKDVNQYQ